MMKEVGKNPEDTPKDDWWRVSGFVDSYNKNQAKILYSSLIMVLDESMSAFRPR